MGKVLYYTGMLCLCAALLYFFSFSGIHSLNAESSGTQFQIKIKPKQQPLRLSFAGDIMAHTVNFRMKDFTVIYKDIKTILCSRDLCFANLETPICNSRPYENYPTFNIHSEYAQAAIDAGFNVFSLANNHTNDQGIEGIRGSADFFAQAEKNLIYSAGLKTNENGGLSYRIIKEQGWTILFAAITEIVNAERHTALFDYYPFTKSGKLQLKNELVRLRAENPCDLCILSIHSADPEYVLEVSNERRNYFYSLLDTGADIIWANHAHVPKPWERVSYTDENGRTAEKLIMYGLGNTISGQNPSPNFDNPAHPHEYTSSGLLLHVDVTQKNDFSQPVLQFTDIKAQVIVTHIDNEYNFVIRRLHEDFIAGQGAKTAAYYRKRSELMRNIREITTCR